MSTRNPKLFEKIRLAVNSLRGYGLVCNDKRNPLLSREEVLEALEKIEREDRMYCQDAEQSEVEQRLRERHRQAVREHVRDMVGGGPS
jgi:hypothetical protein